MLELDSGYIKYISKENTGATQLYAIIAKNYDVEIYIEGRLHKIVKAALTYQQSVDYCRFQGLEIRDAR